MNLYIVEISGNWHMPENTILGIIASSEEEVKTITMGEVAREYPNARIKYYGESKPEWNETDIVIIYPWHKAGPQYWHNKVAIDENQRVFDIKDSEPGIRFIYHFSE